MGILSISWEDFMDLMKFNSRASAAFLDLYCGPLKLILSDPTLSSKLSQAMPKKANMNAFVTGIVSDKPSETTTISTNPDDFDNCYNGLKLVPKKLRPEMVDALRCQCIIRVVLLRLEPVKNLRKAVAEVSSALHMMQSVSNSNADLNMEKLNQVNREYWSGASQQKSVRFNNIITPQKTLSEKSSINTLELSAETMVLINTPKSKSKSKANGLNKDAIFNITSDCVSRLEEIYNVARALEGTELHMLSLHDKIILLKVLCDACYDSKRIRELLENHADERATKIQEMNRMKREQNAKLKEISATKKQAALEACRKLNMEAAHKKETSTGSKSKSKKAVTKAQSNSSAKDNFDPSTEQLNAMIDDLIMLEAYGIDTVIEDISIEETDSDDEEDSKREEDSNEEEDEGEYLGSRRFAVASRAKALDRKKATAERVQRNSLIVLSYEKIAYAMETKNERDLRGAIKAAERAGFKGINENDEVYCTQMLKQVIVNKILYLKSVL